MVTEHPRRHRRVNLLRRLSTAANYDFCPWANRYVYWLKHPIGWFAVAAFASLLLAVFVMPQAWGVFAALVSVMVLGTLWPWMSMRGLSAEITFDRRRCCEQDAVKVVLTVVNRRPWPAWGLLVEGGFFQATAQTEEEATTALARVGAWSKTRFEFTFHPPRRGKFPHEVPLLVTGFPFGIWSARKTIVVNERLIAWPRSYDLKSLPMLPGERMAAVGSFVDRAGHDGDVLAARPYIQGDSMRKVHWVHTARRDTLIVCERQMSSRRSVLVVLDSQAFGASGAVMERHAWDWSLRVLASLCREFHGHACDLACELNGERFAVPSSTAGLHCLFDRLAYFEPKESATSTDLRHTIRVESNDRLTIMVTSNRSWQDSRSLNERWRRASGVRSVVLDPEPAAAEDRYDSGEAVLGGSVRPWMSLTLGEDPAKQLRQQWERRCHDDWAK